MAHPEDEIRREVKETREQMGEVLEALIQELDVRFRAQETLQNARSTAVGYAKRGALKGGLALLVLAIFLFAFFFWYRRR